MTREPDASQWQQIKTLLQSGHQEEAVRFYREVSGAGMFEAKDKIAELAAEMLLTPPAGVGQPPDRLAPFPPTQQFGNQVDTSQSSMSDDITTVINKHRGLGTLSLKEAFVLIVNLCKGLPASTGGHLRAVAPPRDFDEIDRDILAGANKSAAAKYARSQQTTPEAAEAIIAAREDMLRQHVPNLFHSSGNVINIKSKWASWAVLIFALLLMLLFVVGPIVLAVVLMQVMKNLPT